MKESTKKKKEKKSNNLNNKTKTTKNKLPKITKEYIIYLILGLLDIVIIIYSARHNYAHYVSIAGSKNVYIGDTFRNLIFGKNYITLVITAFFFSYICLLNKFMFHKKNTKKFVLILLISLILVNCILFYTFTNKIY